jgi:hypothetical protein
MKRLALIFGLSHSLLALATVTCQSPIDALHVPFGTFPAGQLEKWGGLAKDVGAKVE